MKFCRRFLGPENCEYIEDHGDEGQYCRLGGFKLTLDRGGGIYTDSNRCPKLMCDI